MEKIPNTLDFVKFRQIQANPGKSRPWIPGFLDTKKVPRSAKNYQLYALGVISAKKYQKRLNFEKLLNFYVNPAAGKRQSQ